MAVPMQNRMMYLALAGIYPVLFFVLMVYSSAAGEGVPFSLEAFVQPYSGPMAMISAVLAGLAIADVFVYYFLFYSKYVNDPRSHMLLVVYPEAIALFGFIIAFLNLNPWAAVPFFALAFGIYAFVYLRISAQPDQGSNGHPSHPQ